MKLLKIYSWLVGKMNDFTKDFSRDEMLYNQARNFWNKLDNASLGFVILMVVFGIFTAYLYYGPYNNMPGRKYTPKHWLILMAVSVLLTFVGTLVYAYFAAKPTMHGSWNLELKISLCNAIYAALVYFVTSAVICRSGMKTNAYRLF